MLAADIRFAQRMSIIEGRRWFISFDIANNLYRVRHLFPPTIVKTVEIPNGVSLRFTSYPDLFYLPRGTPTNGMSIWLSKGNYWQRTTVTPGGGRVDIKEIVYSTNGSQPITLIDD
jgi:hypothetical protein